MQWKAPGRDLALVALWLSSAARVARAQDPADPGSTGEGTGSAQTRELELASKRPYWSGGLRRGFLASTLEVGFFYLRTQMGLGYGRPHWEWIGIEEQTRVSGSGGSEYFGLRAALPFLEARGGARYMFPADQAFLPIQDEYSRSEVLAPETPNSRYFALEGEIVGSVSLLGGSLFGAANIYYLTGIPEGYNVFEESLHVVVDPPWLWRVRVGHLLAFGKEGALRVGVAAEVIGIPDREAFVVRFGPQFAVSLTHHLDALAAIMATAHSPDRLRLLGAEVGQFGLRYKWATGDPFPEFP